MNAYEGAGRRALVGAVLPLAAALAVSIGVIATATSASSSGIDKAKLDRSLSKRSRTSIACRPESCIAPALQRQSCSASCDKGGGLVPEVGAGNDWRCVVSWRLPGATAIGSAIHQLDVTPDGRYRADGDGPQEVDGFFQLRTARGDAPNPLSQFDGSVDLLTPASSR